LYAGDYEQNVVYELMNEGRKRREGEMERRKRKWSDNQLI
jgi:hypothetical protein